MFHVTYFTNTPPLRFLRKDKNADFNKTPVFFMLGNLTRIVVKERTNKQTHNRPTAFFRHEELERVRRFVSGTTEGVMNSLPPTQI